MGLFTDLDFIGRISGHLDRFRWVNPSRTANFRCPVCGDSKRNPRKARGYLFVLKDTFVYKCHACGTACSLKKFIELKFPQYVDEYRLESFKENSGTGFASYKPKTLDDDPVQEAPIVVAKPDFYLSDLPKAHQAVKFVAGRKIPESRWDDIGYTENFAQWVVKASGITKYKRLPKDARILLELRDEEGRLFGVQGRAIDPGSSLRYITIRFNDDHPKLFGLESVNTTQPIIVTEGPIDSLFLPNAIAICGGDVSMSLNRFRGKEVIVALDNEPRSKDTVSRMNAAIDKGFKVCFWGIDTKFKDINDMVLKGGMTPEMIMTHIHKNSYSGGYAKATMLTWKKI